MNNKRIFYGIFFISTALVASQQNLEQHLKNEPEAQVAEEKNPTIAVNFNVGNSQDAHSKNNTTAQSAQLNGQKQEDKNAHIIIENKESAFRKFLLVIGMVPLIVGPKNIQDIIGTIIEKISRK